MFCRSGVCPAPLAIRLGFKLLPSADILNNSTIYPKDYSKGITLTVLNTQSLKNKAAIFIDFICEYQPDLLAATETWFTDGESASKTLCTPGGYRFFDHSRSGRRGGGTGLLFKNNLMVTKVTGGEHQSFEYSEWKVTSGSRRVNLIIMYRPPYSAAHPVTSAVFFVEFAEYLESIVLSADPLLIVGDFNIHIDSNENYDAIKLSELLQSFSLTQHVQVPTHSSGHTLDLIITRKTDDLISSVPIELVVYFQVICLSSVNLTWVRYFLPNQTFRIGTSRRLIWMPCEQIFLTLISVKTVICLIYTNSLNLITKHLNRS